MNEQIRNLFRGRHPQYAGVYLRGSVIGTFVTTVGLMSTACLTSCLPLEHSVARLVLSIVPMPRTPLRFAQSHFFVLFSIVSVLCVFREPVSNEKPPATSSSVICDV